MRGPACRRRGPRSKSRRPTSRRKKPTSVPRVPRSPTPASTSVTRACRRRSRGARAAALDRQVDVTTGTVLARGVFSNPGNVLRPGQYAKIRAVVETRKGALLVPQRAVHDVQGTQQVAVVKADDTVDVRTVKCDVRVGPLWVIADGLKPGERVVVEGGRSEEHTSELQ